MVHLHEEGTPERGGRLREEVLGNLPVKRISANEVKKKTHPISLTFFFFFFPSREEVCFGLNESIMRLLVLMRCYFHVRAFANKPLLTFNPLPTYRFAQAMNMSKRGNLFSINITDRHRVQSLSWESRITRQRQTRVIRHVASANICAAGAESRESHLICMMLRQEQDIYQLSKNRSRRRIQYFNYCLGMTRLRQKSRRDNSKPPAGCLMRS